MYKKFQILFLDNTNSKNYEKKKTVVVFVKTFNYQPTKTWEVFKKKKKTLKNKR